MGSEKTGLEAGFLRSYQIAAGDVTIQGRTPMSEKNRDDTNLVYRLEKKIFLP